jgi:hypothetical protein
MTGLVCVLVAIGGWQELSDSQPGNLDEKKSTFTVVVDAGAGKVTTYSGVAIAKNMSVIAALEKLRSRGLRFRSRGSGATAFVESINGIKNSGSGRNWIYFVNDKKATKGAGVYLLKAGDIVLWKYADKVK